MIFLSQFYDRDFDIGALFNFAERGNATAWCDKIVHRNSCGGTVLMKPFQTNKMPRRKMDQERIIDI